MTQPAEVEALSEELRAAYRAAWEAIDAEQVEIVGIEAKDLRRRRLRELQQMVEQRMTTLEGQARVWLSDSFPLAWRLGGESAATTMGQPWRWTLDDINAVTLLAQDGFDDLLAATNGVRESTKDFVRRMARERVAVGTITGETPRQTARRLAGDLAREGIKAITYKDGSRHGLAEYASMTVRTKSATAYNLAGLELGRRSGVQYVEVFDGTQDAVCAAVANSIQTLEWAMANPLGHPNCVMEGTTFTTPGDVTEMLRARFSGPAVCFTTPARNDSTTIGPNHPVLTRRGWIAAGLLKEGDELLHRRRAENSGVGRRGKPNFEDVPRVEDVFETVLATGLSTHAAATSLDFHGDGVFCEREIDVVWPQRSLLVEADSVLTQQGGEGVFVRADAQLSAIARLGTPDAVFDRVLAAALGSVGRGGVVATAFHPEPGVAELLSFAARSRDTEGTEPFAYRRTGHVQDRADFGTRSLLDDVQAVEGRIVGFRPARSRTDSSIGVLAPNREDDAASLAGQRHPSRGDEAIPGTEPSGFVRVPMGAEKDDSAVFTGEFERHGYEWVPVLSVKRIWWEGYVYDASTTCGFYLSDGYCVRNCQRSTSLRPDLTTAEQARNAPRSTTEEQRADQTASERARTAQNAQRAARRRALRRTVAARAS